MAEPITPDDTHVDYVVNDWDAERSYRRATLRVEHGDLVADWPTETVEVGATMFLDFCWGRIVPPNWPDNPVTPSDLRRLTSGPEQVHWVFTEPHSPKDCPFGESWVLDMERIEPSEDLRFLTPAEVEALTDDERARLR